MQDSTPNAEVQSQKAGSRHQSRYILLLLALLFIGFATYGTYSYFTDDVTVDSDISLSTGTVSLGAPTVSQNWTYNPLTSEDNSAINTDTTNDDRVESGETRTNLQPGDYYEKEVTLAYTGSLDALLSVAFDDDVATAITNSDFEVSLNVYTKTGTTVSTKPVLSVDSSESSLPTATTPVTIQANGDTSYVVELRVGVPIVASEELYGSGRNTDDGVTLDAVENAIKFDVVQSNITE
ncbi:MAG: hypothetical protein ACK5MN_11705 [Lachnospiraceae bacterium]